MEVGFNEAAEVDISAGRLMELSVGDLVAMRQLACTAIAGASGLGHRVLWAHSCELPNPWEWLGQHELLMTVGICIPDAAAEQVEFVRRLHQSGLAGLAVALHPEAPPLHPEMLAAADSLAFPVLDVNFHTPFTAIGRTVAIASQSTQVARIARLSRLYDLTHSAEAGKDSLLVRLSGEVGHSLHVLDVEHRTEVLESGGALAPDLIEDISIALAKEPLRHAPRLTLRSADAVTATVLELSTHRRCFLVVDGPSELNLDAFALLHVQTLIATEIERLTREREREDAAGAELFMKIVDREIDSDTARARLEQIGLDGTAWLMLAFGAESVATARAVLGDARLPTISAELGREGFVMIAAPDRQRVEQVLLPRLTATGISAATSSLGRISDTVTEARWALQAARSSGGGLSEYSKTAPMFLPRTVSDAQDAAHAVLGELVEYDQTHDSHLLETLEAFLTADRQWDVVAQELQIHRQTLGYRLRRIESLTGRNTRRSADIAMLWTALNAYRIGGTAR